MKNENISTLTERYLVYGEKQNGCRYLVGITANPVANFTRFSNCLFLRQSDGVPFRFIDGAFVSIHPPVI